MKPRTIKQEIWVGGGGKHANEVRRANLRITIQCDQQNLCVIITSSSVLKRKREELPRLEWNEDEKAWAWVSSPHLISQTVHPTWRQIISLNAFV